jgi:general secretion pathway protein N
MLSWRKIIGLALLSGGTLTGLSPELPAATSSTSDVLATDRAPDAADSVDLGSIKPIARPSREASKPLPGGNPLWAVPLSVLSVTRERPVFTASRRPPPQAVAMPQVEQVRAPPPPAGPEHPPLSLIGAVVGDNDAIAVFLDRTNQKVVRLRQGDSHAGWEVSSVRGREVTLKKADQTETLGLQRQEGPAAVAGGPVPGLPVPAVLPASGTLDSNYAPFTPRATPKNGESDGL